MEVKLIAYTPNAEEICARAMRSCRTKEDSSSLSLPKLPEYYIKKAIEVGHESVLEHATFTFAIKDVSRVLTHQLVRHRIASYSQQSERDVSPSFTLIPLTINESKYSKRSIELMNEVMRFCDEMICNGIPREDARYLLPNGVLTNITVTMNGRELRHFLKLRLYPPAQWEIRNLAKLMLNEAKRVAPNIFGDID